MFQKTIAQSRFTLTIASIIATLAWVTHALLRPTEAATTHFGRPWSTFAVTLLVAAVAIYLMAELNNTFALLRISSRMLSTTLAMLLAMASTLHTSLSSTIILTAFTAAFFPLFATYQRPYATGLSYLLYLIWGCIALLFPHFLMFVPVGWAAQIVLRSFSLKSWCASLLGLLTPCWLLFTVVFVTDHLTDWLNFVYGWLPLEWPRYDDLQVKDIAVLGFTFLLFLLGTIDFLQTSHLEKTRNRYHYYATMLYGFVAYGWMLLQPQQYSLILPVCIVCSAIMGGHFIALSYGKVQNIITIVLTLAALGIVFIL